MRCISVVVVCIVLAVSAPASAERAWFFSSYGNAQFTEVSVDNGGRTWSPLRHLSLPPHRVRTQPILSAGGRFIVWTGARNSVEPSTLLALDTETGQLHPFTNIPLHNRDGTVRLANDRRSGRLVVRDEAGLYLIDLHGRTPLMTISLPRLGRRSDFLATGRGRIFVGWEGDSYGAVTPHITVIDGSSGMTIGDLPGESTGVLSADERRFYAISYSATAATTLARVSVYDTETLELVSHGVVPAFAPSFIDGAFLTSTAGVRVLPGHDFYPVFRAYSATSFALLGELAPPLLYRSSLYGSDVTFSTGFGGATLYVTSYARPVQDVEGCGSWRRIDVFDMSTLEYLATIDPSQFSLDVCYPARYLSPPDPPTRLRTETVAGNVHLEWDPPADITDYEILVGSRPDASDVGELRTYGKAFADFHGAPRGTYYVRVRARNELGMAESAAIRIVVP